MDLKDRQREAMRLAAQIESQAAEAKPEAKSAGGEEWEGESEAKGAGREEWEGESEAKSAGGKEWEAEFLFYYRCHTSLRIFRCVLASLYEVVSVGLSVCLSVGNAFFFKLQK